MAFAGAATTLKQTGSASYTYVGSSGLAHAGSALASKSKAWIASGGLAVLGASISTKTKSFYATGGLQLAGSAVGIKAKSFAGSGGGSFSGGAITQLQSAAQAVYAYVGSGISNLGGQAVSALYSAEIPQNTPDGASGGNAFYCGTGAPIDHNRRFAYASSGRLRVSGASVTQHNPVITQEIAVICQGKFCISGYAATEFHDPNRQARNDDELLLLL